MAGLALLLLENEKKKDRERKERTRSIFLKIAILRRTLEFINRTNWLSSYYR